MRFVVSSTVRTFTNAVCSFGTLHLRGMFVPKEELTQGQSHSQRPENKQDDPKKSSVDESEENSQVSSLDTSAFVVRCIDSESIPGELHVFVEFDLPQRCTILTKKMAGHITQLVVRVLDDLEDLLQDGTNEGINIVKSHIGEFVSGCQEPATNEVHLDDISPTEEKAADMDREAVSRGVLVYGARARAPDSRFLRARQQEAAVRFYLNTGDTDSSLANKEMNNANFPGARASSGHSFAISNYEGLLCTAFIGRAGMGPYLQPGDSFSVRLDFSDAEQACIAVKVELVLKLLQSSGTSHQGQGLAVARREVISSGFRNSEHALELNIRLTLPRFDVPSAGMQGMSLESPGISSTDGSRGPEGGGIRRYWLDFSFYLPDSDQRSRPPFFWAVPLDVQVAPTMGSQAPSDIGNVFQISNTEQLYVVGN